jgi:hypothetical protein
MNAYRASNGRGTLIIDRILPGIGRIQRASGTHKVSEKRAIDAMITELHERGKRDAGFWRPLELLRDKEAKPIDVLHSYRAGKLDEIGDAKRMRPLWTTWDSWVDKTRAKQTARQRKFAKGRLQAVAPERGTMTMGHLPDLLLALRERTADQPVTFNRVRAAVMAFLRDRLTKRHALYLDCKAIEAYPEKAQRARRIAPTVRKALQVREALPPKAADIWWAMYTHGMGPDEFDLAWVVEAGWVAVPGTKRTARQRRVPRLGTPGRRAMGWKQFREALVATKLGVQPYDARRGYEHLLEEVRAISGGRRKLYMGHALSTTENYGRTDLDAFLASDAQLLQARIVAEETAIAAERRKQLRSA